MGSFFIGCRVEPSTSVPTEQFHVVLAALSLSDEQTYGFGFLYDTQGKNIIKTQGNDKLYIATNRLGSKRELIFSKLPEAFHVFKGEDFFHWTKMWASKAERFFSMSFMREKKDFSPALDSRVEMPAYFNLFLGADAAKKTTQDVLDISWEKSVKSDSLFLRVQSSCIKEQDALDEFLSNA